MQKGNGDSSSLGLRDDDDVGGNGTCHSNLDRWIKPVSCVISRPIIDEQNLARVSFYLQLKWS
jgi:hypothetical protein